MCITAHPDDESAGFGGALLMANAAGVETSVVCLTEGQAATNRGAAKSGEELAQIRRAELAAAAKILHITRSEVLSYPDGKLASIDFSELTHVLVERIRELRPQVVLTFGSDGGVNLHRDHMVASLAATTACQLAGRSAYTSTSKLAPYAPQKLYYLCPPFISSRDPAEGETVAQTPHSLVLELGAWKQTKLEAFLKHDSQAIILERVRKAFEEHGSKERYLLVASRVQRTVADDDSLFAAVVED